MVNQTEPNNIKKRLEEIQANYAAARAEIEAAGLKAKGISEQSDELRIKISNGEATLGDPIEDFVFCNFKNKDELLPRLQKLDRKIRDNVGKLIVVAKHKQLSIEITLGVINDLPSCSKGFYKIPSRYCHPYESHNNRISHDKISFYPNEIKDWLNWQKNREKTSAIRIPGHNQLTIAIGDDDVIDFFIEYSNKDLQKLFGSRQLLDYPGIYSHPKVKEWLRKEKCKTINALKDDLKCYQEKMPSYAALTETVTRALKAEQKFVTVEIPLYIAMSILSREGIKQDYTGVNYGSVRSLVNRAFKLGLGNHPTVKRAQNTILK